MIQRFLLDMGTGEQLKVLMPRGAKIVKAEVLDVDRIYLYAEVDPDAELLPRCFDVAVDGAQVDSGLEYVISATGAGYILCEEGHTYREEDLEVDENGTPWVMDVLAYHVYE